MTDQTGMMLDEALAIREHIGRVGYPNRDQVAALAAAEEVIARCANEAVARFIKRDSASPG